MIAPVSRTSSLQHARRAYHDGGGGDSSLEHTPPRVMRSVSAPGSGVKDDASTRSISSDTVRRVSVCCVAAGNASCSDMAQGRSLALHQFACASRCHLLHIHALCCTSSMQLHTASGQVQWLDSASVCACCRVLQRIACRACLEPAMRS